METKRKKAEDILEDLPLNRHQIVVVAAVVLICMRSSLQLYGIAFIAHEVPLNCGAENMVGICVSFLFFFF